MKEIVGTVEIRATQCKKLVQMRNGLRTTGAMKMGYARCQFRKGRTDLALLVARGTISRGGKKRVGISDDVLRMTVRYKL